MVQELSILFVFKIFILLHFMCMNVLPTCICAPFMCWAPAELRSGHQIPVTRAPEGSSMLPMRELAVELRVPGIAASALNLRVISPAILIIFGSSCFQERVSLC